MHSIIDTKSSFPSRQNKINGYSSMTWTKSKCKYELEIGLFRGANSQLSVSLVAVGGKKKRKRELGEGVTKCNFC